MIIAVIDTETTGTYGAPFDHVVDIGVSLVDTQKLTVKPYFGTVVGYDVEKWDQEHRNAWIFTHTDLTLDMVRNAPPAEEVAEDLRAVLDEYPVTSFNQEFDFNKFLDREPWSITNPKAPDIMTVADTIEEIPRSKYDPSTGWRSYPKVDATYFYLYGEQDPAGINKEQTHRALSDTVVEGYILTELIKRGLYKGQVML